jgi:hypothetical protein
VGLMAACHDPVMLHCRCWAIAATPTSSCAVLSELPHLLMYRHLAQRQLARLLPPRRGAMPWWPAHVRT